MKPYKMLYVVNAGCAWPFDQYVAFMHEYEARLLLLREDDSFAEIDH